MSNTSTDLNISEPSVSAFDELELPRALLRDMRSNHAGETGAVCIYAGVLAVSRDPALRAFATEHIETERRHLAFFDAWLPARHQSRLTPLWRVAGWLVGALPALAGPRAVYTTVRAVEDFVERHYAAQIETLAEQPAWGPLRARLQAFCAEEIAHRDEAGHRLSQPPGPIGRGWATIVAAGSAAGAAAARRF
jgi:ubiquinone biosynthesis monooxygenase Coq7